MRVFGGMPLDHERKACVLTIGNFDGVHLGHQALLSQLRKIAAADGLETAVMTFEPQPKEFFQPETAPARIFTLRDKLDALQHQGVDRVFVQHFNARFAAIDPVDFIKTRVVGSCKAQVLAAGTDFRFGARRAGDLSLVQQLAPALDLKVLPVADVCENAQRISSSWVRKALAQADFITAQHLLGRPYCISGHVVYGQQLGRTLGFPTLNVRLDFHRPALNGIFNVMVEGVADAPLPGVASLGTRPTVDNSGTYNVEVHLLNFNRDVYGQLVRITFLHKQRDEQRFENLDAMVLQMQQDVALAKTYFAARDHQTRV